ncbi:MAG TPA: ABC-type transport auxiliary lipoprotein family protein [Syntrophorhabdaceae bacterium]|nr:ABC-type transport auxiliary lipoprotein family protein [Syntrophorhabdaceae bacterium]
MTRSFAGTAGLYCVPLICLALIAGCLGRTKPPYVMDQYTLDYAPGAVTAGQPVQELIRVERFAVAPAFNSTNMAIRKGQYRFETYNYSRWRVNPADMVAGFVLRDITRAGIFKGTYSWYDSDLSRYILEGYVDEFCESSGKGLLSVRITLVDTKAKNPVEQVVFQRQYTQSAPMDDSSPDALAAALSAAMKEVSGRLMTDIAATLRESADK